MGIRRRVDLVATAYADELAVQAMLCHSAIVLTANTYTSVLPQVARDAAEAAAALLPRRRRAQPNPLWTANGPASVSG